MPIYPTRESLEDHEVVSYEQWLIERKALLRREKELTRLRDEISAQRRERPGAGQKELRLPRVKRSGDACRSLRGPQPVVRSAFHARSRLGGRLQRLLLLGGSPRRREAAKEWGIFLGEVPWDCRCPTHFDIL